MLLHRMHDWQYFAEPEASMDGRAIECARGKVIGGSSSINAMAYVRGHRGDYERWADSGLGAWSYAHVLPYFRRQESWQGGADPYRGADGPLTTCAPRFPDPLIDAFLAATSSAGHPSTPDYNGAEQEGFGRSQSTIRNGRRCSTAVAYLRPAMARGNLTVEVNALVAGLVLEGNRAVGVRYEQDGQVKIARAAREVILAGGSINSPQLLMLSGIGDPAELGKHGIEVKVPLKGVGKNLQDHVSIALAVRRKEPGPLHRALRADRIVGDLFRTHFFGSGITGTPPNNAMGFLKSDASQAIPDLQFLFVAASYEAGPYLAPFKQAYADGFACRPVQLRPESRGTLSLRSADPKAPARLEFNFLSTDKDLKAVRTGLRMTREIFQQSPLRDFIDVEVSPGKDKVSDADIDAYARSTGQTVYHPLGTCRMGTDKDEMAVVDPELRVRGVDNLRVVDASVMPDLVGGNINAPVIMIAEKAADFIRGRRPLDPVNI
jgi:choline dehydrogenase/4-pyridoxate dehydrogenase